MPGCKNVCHGVYVDTRRVRATSMKPMAGLDVTAFGSTFVLLSIAILIVVSAGQSYHHGVSVSWPGVMPPHSMWQAERSDALVIALFRTGDIFFGNDKLAADQLGEKIRERLRTQNGDRKIYIRADARAKWACVGEVLDQVRAAGVVEVGFLADRRKDKKSARLEFETTSRFGDR
jgi:biopolymer transport protein TolR